MMVFELLLGGIILSFIAFNYLGKIDLGYQTSEEALRIAEESGDIYSKGLELWFHGGSCYFKGFFKIG